MTHFLALINPEAAPDPKAHLLTLSCSLFSFSSLLQLLSHPMLNFSQLWILHIVGFAYLQVLHPSRSDLKDWRSSAGFSTSLRLPGWLSRNSSPNPQAFALARTVTVWLRGNVLPKSGASMGSLLTFKAELVSVGELPRSSYRLSLKRQMLSALGLLGKSHSPEVLFLIHLSNAYTLRKWLRSWPRTYSPSFPMPLTWSWS